MGDLWFTNKKVKSADVNPPQLKIRHDFEQLQILTANIPGADRHAKIR